MGLCGGEFSQDLMEGFGLGEGHRRGDMSPWGIMSGLGDLIAATGNVHMMTCLGDGCQVLPPTITFQWGVKTSSL